MGTCEQPGARQREKYLPPHRASQYRIASGVVAASMLTSAPSFCRTERNRSHDVQSRERLRKPCRRLLSRARPAPDKNARSAQYWRGACETRSRRDVPLHRSHVADGHNFFRAVTPTKAERRRPSRVSAPFSSGYLNSRVNAFGAGAPNAT